MPPTCQICLDLNPTHFEYYAPLEVYCHNIDRAKLLEGVHIGCETCAILDRARREVAAGSLELYRSFVGIFTPSFGTSLQFILVNRMLDEVRFHSPRHIGGRIYAVDRLVVILEVGDVGNG